MTDIHPSAVIEDGAELGSNVSIGPYCHVGANVRIGNDVVLHGHVAVAGHTSIGARTVVHSFAVLGHPPQDMKHAGGKTTLEIGEDNVIREHVTMHLGTENGRSRTSVGSSNLFMVGSHVAHDCVVGNHVTFANNATLGGHCTIGDHVYLGGLCAIHQFVRIGDHAFVGGLSAVVSDVMPFCLATSERAHLAGLNVVGLKRRGFARSTIHNLRKAYRRIFDRDGNFKERLEEASNSFGTEPSAKDMLAFATASAHRPLCSPER